MGKSLFPICGWCKRIRVSDQRWQTIEEYLSGMGVGDITHGMCPACSEKIFEKRIYLESYQDICKKISSSISLDEVLELIVENVVKVMHVRASLLRLMNMKSRTLDVVAHYGLSDGYINKGTIKFDKSIEDALAGKSVSVYDITSDPSSEYHKQAMAEGIRSIVSIPLKFRDEVIGVLRMYTDEPVKYTKEDLRFLEAIAEQAAIAIMNARQFGSIVDKQKEYLRLFHEISKAVNSTHEIQAVLSMIVREVTAAIKVKAATIRLLDDVDNGLTLVASYGLSEEYLNKGPVDKELNIMEALKERPVAIYDIETDDRVIYRKEAARENIKSMLVIPIKFRDRIIGVMRLLCAVNREFSAQEINFATTLAEQCGIAIENARLFEKKYKEIEYLNAIREVTKIVNMEMDLNKSLPEIVKKLQGIMNTKAVTLRVINPDTGRLELIAASGVSKEYLMRGGIDDEEGVQSVLSGDIVAIYDALTDPRIIYNKEALAEGIKSILAIPLTIYDKTIGVMRLLTGEHRHFTDIELGFAASLADVMAMAIDNSWMHKT